MTKVTKVRVMNLGTHQRSAFRNLHHRALLVNSTGYPKAILGPGSPTFISSILQSCKLFVLTKGKMSLLQLNLLPKNLGKNYG